MPLSLLSLAILAIKELINYSSSIANVQWEAFQKDESPHPKVAETADGP